MANFEEILAGDKLVLVDFFATWCGPCKMMHPILEELALKVGDKVKIVKIDIDRNRDLTAEYNVQSVPTLMIFKNGDRNPVWREAGVRPASDLEEILKKYY